MANSREIALKLTLDGSDARQNLEQIKQASIDFGKEGEFAADKLTAGFADLEAQTTKLHGAIEKGKVVTDSSVTAMSAKYVSLEQQIERTFGEFDKIPAEVQAAMQVAAAQITSVITAQDRLKTTTAQTAQAFRDIALPSAEVDRFASRIEIATKAERDFAHAYNEGSQEVGEKLSKLIGQQILFQREIDETKQRGGTVGPEIVQAYDRIGAAIDKATTDVREFNIAMAQKRTSVQMTGERIDGLGSALQGLLSPLGGVAGAAGNAAGTIGNLGSAAVNAQRAFGGLNSSTLAAAGRFAALPALVLAVVGASVKLEQALGNNVEAFDELEKSMKAFAQDLLLPIKNMGAVERQAQDMLASILAVKEAEDIPKAIADGVQKLAAAMGSGTAGARNMSAAIAAGLPVMERNKIVLSEYNTVAEFFDRTQRTGADGAKLWADAVQQSGGTAEGLRTAAAALTPELERLEATTGTSAAAQETHAGATQRNSTAMGAASEKAADLAQKQYELENAFGAATKASNAMTLPQDEWFAFNEKTGQATKNFDEYKQQVVSLLPEMDKNSARILDITGKMEAALRIRTDLTAAERAAAQAQIDQVEANVKVATSLDNWIVKADLAHQKMMALGNVNFSGTVSGLDSVATAADRAAESANNLGNALGSASSAGLNTNEGGSSIRNKDGVTMANGDPIKPKAPGSYDGSGFGGGDAGMYSPRRLGKPK